MSLDVDLSSEAQLLTSYAMFEAFLCDDNQSALQGTHRALLPFLVTALRRVDNQVVTIENVARQLLDSFGLTFPQDILANLLKLAWHQSLLTRQSEGQITYFTINHDAVDRWPDTEELAANLRRDHGLFVREFRRFGREKFDLNFTRDEAECALHSLMLDRIDAVSAARDYAAVATSWSAHMAPSDAGYVLGRFIEEEVRPASDLHDYLDRIAKGSALAVAIFYRGHQIDRLSGAMRGLRVFFDTPLILSLLGYHKNEDQAAAEDVLRLVRDSGAQPSVFQHTCTETRNVLRGSVNDMRSAEHGQALESRMPVVERFVQSALAGVDQSKRRSRYLIDAERLPSILKERGFSVEQLPSSEHPTAQQEGLASLIRALYATEPSSRTVEFDVKSVLGIYQIRSGRSFDSLDEAEAIFVTSNPRLVEAASTHFTGTLSRENIPICYTSDVLANLLWLQHPLDLPGVPWRQVVAYMYAGLYPGEDLWHRYTHLLDEMRSGEPGISEEDYFILRFTIGARQALMDDTRGDPGLLTVGKISEILLRARDQLTSELQAELNSKESALAENLKRLSELRELVTEEERRRTVADAEVELIRRSIPIERWAAVQELLEMRSQAAARAARRTVEAIVVGSIALSVILSIISIRSGAIPPTSISILVVLLVAIASFLGYLNLKRGWNFDELERSVARRLTSLQVNRLSRTIRKRDETAPARQRELR